MNAHEGTSTRAKRIKINVLDFTKEMRREGSVVKSERRRRSIMERSSAEPSTGGADQVQVHGTHQQDETFRKKRVSHSSCEYRKNNVKCFERDESEGRKQSGTYGQKLRARWIYLLIKIKSKLDPLETNNSKSASSPPSICWIHCHASAKPRAAFYC